jgi:hypothetical protein
MATQFENLPTSVKKIVDKLVNDKKTKIPGIAKDNEKLKEINKLKRQVAREFIEQANEMKTPREKAVRNVKRVKETKPVIKKVEVEEIVIPRIHKDNEWDFAIGDEVPFFDISLSYELTGYRPIN